MANLEITLWEKAGKRRAYISNPSGARNKREIGYIDLLTSEIVPGHAQNASSVQRALENEGVSAEQIIARFVPANEPAQAQAVDAQAAPTADPLPALTGTRIEIAEGQKARADYLCRAALFLNFVADAGRQAVDRGIATEAQAEAKLSKYSGLHAKALRVTAGSWWADVVGLHLRGYAQDDLKRTQSLMDRSFCLLD